MLFLLAAASVFACSARAKAADGTTSAAAQAQLAPPTGSDEGSQQVASVAADDADEDAAAAAARENDEALELELDDRPTSFPDPLEPLNRRTLSLNQTFDRWVIAPVTRAYGYVVPDRAKRSVRDFFANLESPAIFVNDMLQGEIDDAATTFTRFSVNSIFGLGGFFDPASSMGLERHSADFGQTLARQGVGSGPFLIVPLLGPTTVRDGLGTLVDVAMQPTIYILGPTLLVAVSLHEGTEGLTIREEHGEDLKRLEQASLDYYAALRSAYYQNRMATLGDGPMTSTEPVVSTALPELPPT